MTTPALKLKQYLDDSTPQQRVEFFKPDIYNPEITRKKFLAYFAYYHGKYATHRNIDSKKTQRYILRLCKLLNPDNIWCVMYGFRGLAKTSIGKIFLEYIILYGLANTVLIGCRNPDNATAIATDIYNNLRSRYIVRDFGNRFTGRTDADEKHKDSMSHFKVGKTTVLAFSLLSSIRGILSENEKPDWIFLDDFETESSLRSKAETEVIQANIDEALSGMDERNPKKILLGNYISEAGNLKYYKDQALKEEGEEAVIIAPLFEGEFGKGKIEMPDKYVWTEKEAAIENEKRDPKRRVIPISRLMKSKKFGQEYQQNPRKFGDVEYQAKHIAQCFFKQEPIKITAAGLKIYKDINEDAQYIIGADTAKGVGEDSNTAFILEVLPNGQMEEVAHYADNLIAPHIFARLLVDWGRFYNNAYLVPELNNTGEAVIPVLLEEYHPELVYRMQNKRRPGINESADYGWRTTFGSKIVMISTVGSALEDADLILHSHEIEKELSSFTRNDKVRNDNTTRHFDLLIALALALQGRVSQIGMPVGIEKS